MTTETPLPIGPDFERKPFYSPLEVATIVGISDSTVLARIHAGELHAVQLGPRLYRIPLGAVVQFLGGAPSIRRTANPRAKAQSTTDDPHDAAEH